MAKVNVQHLIAMGFTAEMFAQPTEDFPAWLQGLINEQSQDLAERLGSLYGTFDSEINRRVRLAEKALCCAELIRRRSVQLMALSVPTGEQSPTKEMQKQRAEYLAEAEFWLERVVGAGGGTPGYSGGVVVSSHFPEAVRA